MHSRHITPREKQKRPKELIAKRRRTTVVPPHLNTEDVHPLFDCHESIY